MGCAKGHARLFFFETKPSVSGFAEMRRSNEAIRSFRVYAETE